MFLLSATFWVPPEADESSEQNKPAIRHWSFNSTTVLKLIRIQQVLQQLIMKKCNSAVISATQRKQGIERVQALAVILHLVLCCHGNETRAPFANPPNAQQDGTPTIPQLTSGSAQ